jgi:hypothetical protein
MCMELSSISESESLLVLVEFREDLGSLVLHLIHDVIDHCEPLVWLQRLAVDRKLDMLDSEDLFQLLRDRYHLSSIPCYIVRDQRYKPHFKTVQHEYIEHSSIGFYIMRKAIYAA